MFGADSAWPQKVPRRQAYKNSLPTDVDPKWMRDLWETEAPAWILAQHLGVQLERWPTFMAAMRKRGVDLPHRPCRWMPALCWKARLDAVLNHSG